MLSCEELLELQHNLENASKRSFTFFLRDEVSLHNTPDNAWVVVNGRVLHLNPFLAKPDVFTSPITDELLAYAGKDLSHHFTIDNKPRTRFTIHGTTIPTLAATTLTTRYPTIYDYALDSSLPKIINSSWWDSKDYEIGVITATERPLRIINTLTMTTIHMTVCEEDTIHDIRQKYNQRWNAHSGSYAWRKTFRNKRCDSFSGRLDYNRTLTGNGLLKDSLLPTGIWLFFENDFTIS